MSKVTESNTVKVHYTGTLEDGTIFDSSKEREPLQFTMGQGQLIPGFEKAVLGMAVNESKTFTIPSDEAYGAKREELIQDIDKGVLPPDMEPAVGQQLVSTQPDGRELMVTVVGVSDDKVTIDANHPLAGKDLTFEIEVMEIA